MKLSQQLSKVEISVHRPRAEDRECQIVFFSPDSLKKCGARVREAAHWNLITNAWFQRVFDGAVKASVESARIENGGGGVISIRVPYEGGGWAQIVFMPEAFSV